MIDETTDVAVLNEKVIYYVRYIHNSKVATTFLKICERTADAIECIVLSQSAVLITA